jgi:hypothetical protein
MSIPLSTGGPFYARPVIVTRIDSALRPASALIRISFKSNVIARILREGSN